MSENAMTSQDVRWKQRFENYAKAVALVEEALANGAQALSRLEKEGLMQRFEYTVGLGWKTMKDFMAEGGVLLETLTPKVVYERGEAG
ncbi:MAG: nucleotidyltransferase substrate binding protein [Thermodesulfobacteriota bacterium]